MQTASFEQRQYNINIRYYHIADTNNELINKSVKANIDRLRKHLLDNQTNSTYKWAELQVENIDYNVNDDENADNEQLHIAEYTISIVHHNIF